MNALKLATITILACVVTLVTSGVEAKERTKGRGAPGTPVIYVTSQDLYYDTILLGDEFSVPRDGRSYWRSDRVWSG